MSVLLDIDPLTGAISTMQYDHGTKGLTITRTENVDAILDANTESFNDSGERWRGDNNDFWHYARVPMTTLFAWLQEFNQTRGPGDQVKDPFRPHDEWEKWLYGRLNSGEFRKLRTAPIQA
jgi:hypothetical protein